MHHLSFLALILASLLVLAPGASGQSSSTAVIDAKPLAVESKIASVTLYRGRASVTRSAEVSLEPGAYDLKFANLPETVQPATLQARAGSGGAGGALKVIGVDFAQEAAESASSEQIAKLDAEIEQLQNTLKEIAEQRELIKAQEDFLASLSAKTTAQASEAAGTDKLDIDAIRALMEFIAAERAKLLAARRELDQQQRDLERQLQIAQNKRNAMGGGVGGSSNVSRTAVVTIVATQSTQASIELSYLVSNATWEPVYNVRAMVDGSSATIEYDAMLTQRTGEDWDNVRLLLSTAVPTLAANPPTVQPWFIDIRRPEDLDRAAGEQMPERRAYAGAELHMWEADAVDKDANLERLAADAAVGGGGPSVTFELPRAITVKTNLQKQQRTRIATIDAMPRFIHVATPALTDAVYLRGELANSSAYHLLPGSASIFVGQDYIGPTAIESVAPQGEFKVHFGIDPSVRAFRHLVHKLTENTGLLGGGRRTTYEYRLAIDNGSSPAKPITVELWDRYPVSRDEAIQVELADVSAPLSTDSYYTLNERPQGLLKWIVDVPAGATGRASHVITYAVHIDRAKDLEMTPLPE